MVTLTETIEVTSEETRNEAIGETRQEKKERNNRKKRKKIEKIERREKRRGIASSSS